MVTITFFCVSPVTARVAADTICTAVNETSKASASRRFFMSVLREFGSTSCPVRPGSAAAVPGGSALETEGDQELAGVFDLLAGHLQRPQRFAPASDLVPAVGGDPQGQLDWAGIGSQAGRRR